MFSSEKLENMSKKDLLFLLWGSFKMFDCCRIFMKLPRLSISCFSLEMIFWIIWYTWCNFVVFRAKNTSWVCILVNCNVPSFITKIWSYFCTLGEIVWEKTVAIISWNSRRGKSLIESCIPKDRQKTVLWFPKITVSSAIFWSNFFCSLTAVRCIKESVRKANSGLTWNALSRGWMIFFISLVLSSKYCSKQNPVSYVIPNIGYFGWEITHVTYFQMMGWVRAVG